MADRQRADVNARAVVDETGFGGHTPLFNCVITDKTIHEYAQVTPLGWGRAFHDQSYVSPAAMRLIAERGGKE